MGDLVKNLRRGTLTSETLLLGGVSHDPRMLKAADRIEELETEVERLRGALENVMGHVDTPIARRRLGPHWASTVLPDWLIEARQALEVNHDTD